jgi:hypothetical protein
MALSKVNAGGGGTPFGKKSKNPLIRWLIAPVLGTFIITPLLGVLGTILLGGAVIALPTAAVAFAWDRIDNLFTDQDWKNAVGQVARYTPPTDRENMLLYRAMWVDGQRIEEDNVAHWMNYGRLDSTIYRVPTTGKHVYIFELDRPAQISEIFLVMACKSCDVQVLSHYGGGITGEALAAAYKPDGDLVKPLANHPRRLAAANSIGEALEGASFLTLVVNSQDTDTYLAQILAFPPGKRSNVLWAATPQFDKQYRTLYDPLVSAALGKSAVLAPKPINAGASSTAPDYSFYQPAVDSTLTTSLPVYPVVANGGGGSARVGSGTAGDGVAGYVPVYLSWQLDPSALGGKLDEIGLSWLASYQQLNVNASPGNSGGTGNNNNAGPTPTLDPLNPAPLPTPTPGNGPGGGTGTGTNVNLIYPPAPFAKKWQLYLLDSKDSADQAALVTLFNGTGSLPAGFSLPQARLLKSFDQTSSASVSTGPLALAKDDKRDTLVLVFEQSSFDPAAIPGANSGAGGSNGNGNGSNNGNNNSNATGRLPGQLNGLPYDWLALAEVTAYVLPPAKPTKWPIAATGFSSSGGGAYDIRYGSITADKIEEILKQHPFTGIAPGGGPAGGPAQPNLLTGKGQFFIEMGLKYRINPAYALAQSAMESSYFTTGAILYNPVTDTWGNNGYGLTYNPATGQGGWLSDKCSPTQQLVGGDGVTRYFCGYRTLEDSIEDYFALLAEGYVGGQLAGGRYGPLTTVDQIISVYAPSSDNNDTTHYISTVKALIDEWGAAGAGTSGPVPAINQKDPAEYAGSAYPVGEWSPSTCGPTSATMVIDSLGFNLRIGDVLDYAVPAGSVSTEGTSNWNYLSAISQRYGLGWRAVSFASSQEYLAFLREEVNRGQPVIVNVLDDYYSSGHFFVAVAYDGGNDTFTINDPWGRPISAPAEQVVQQWPAQRLGSIVRLDGHPAILIYKQSGGATNGVS